MARKEAVFLEPEAVSRLGSLDFIARMLVEGFLVGLHRSPYHGFSVEFAEYRQYLPGESTQHIDWRVYGKTDRHYVKRFHEETNLLARVMVDVSASMAAKPEKNRITKLQYAKLLAAALSYLFVKQNDAVGLMTFDNKAREVVPPRSSRRQLLHLLSVLEKAQPGERTDVSVVLHELAERMNRRGLVVLISDLIDEPTEVIRALKHFRHRLHEVIVFHVLDPREVDLDFGKEARFVDPEAEVESVRAQPWHVRESYTAAIDSWRSELGRNCRLHHIDYVPLTTDTPYDRALLAYFNKRFRMA